MADNALGNMGSQLGLINSLRTGNIILDMVICMMIPLLFQGLSLIWVRYQPAIMKFIDSFKHNENVCVKVLEYEVFYYHVSIILIITYFINLISSEPIHGAV
jgi:hypothetical protein